MLAKKKGCLTNISIYSIDHRPVLIADSDILSLFWGKHWSKSEYLVAQ